MAAQSHRQVFVDTRLCAILRDDLKYFPAGRNQTLKKTQEGNINIGYGCFSNVIKKSQSAVTICSQA